MKFFYLLFIHALFASPFVNAQTALSGGMGTVQGKVSNAANQEALPGIRVEIVNISPKKGTETDAKGEFKFLNLPYGRYRLLFTAPNFQSVVVSDVVVGGLASGELSVEMEPAREAKKTETLQPQVLPQVTHTENRSNRAYNPFSAVAARPFTVEEVLRYAGARFDPSRLVTNFAGVSSYDEARNDIVVRGNNPAGLSWQIEELPIENPNHHSLLTGSTGGVLPLLNIYAMGKADFVMGGFSAQYGNFSAGVFDLTLRQGNNSRFRGLLQLGSQRAEALIEGPMGKRGGSYLLAMRHSIGDRLFNSILPTDPPHRDFNLKLNFGKVGNHAFEFFALGGQSSIFSDHSQATLIDKIRYQIFEGEDHDFKSYLGLGGLKHTWTLNRRAFWRTVVGLYQHGAYYAWTYNDPTTGERSRTYTGIDTRRDYQLHSYYQGTHLRGQLLLRGGVLAGMQHLNLLQVATYANAIDAKVHRNFFNVQPYLQARYQLNDQLQLFGGVRAIYHQMASLNSGPVFDPRFALRWQAGKKHSMGLSYAMVHQAPEIEQRFYHTVVGRDSTGEFIYDFENGRTLDFMQTQFFDLEYNFIPAENWKIKLAAYAQLSNKAATQADSLSGQYTYLNNEATFYAYYFDLLANLGQSQKWGVELTLEKSFSKGFYLLASGTFFDLRQRIDQGPWRNSAYNNSYIANLLLGREFRFGNLKQHIFFADLRFSTKGGRPYRPIDVEATYQEGFQNNGLEPVFDEALAYKVRTPAFYQVDVKLGLRLNGIENRMAHTFRIDLFNVFNIKNVFTYQYSAVFDYNTGHHERGEVIPIYQRGFIPDITYTFQF